MKTITQNFTYHDVFASALATYFNLRKELEASRIGGNAYTASKVAEALAVLSSCLLYAVILRRNAPENTNIPKGHIELAKWAGTKFEECRQTCKNDNLALDCYYALTIEKMDAAGLVATNERNFGERAPTLEEKLEAMRQR